LQYRLRFEWKQLPLKKAEDTLAYTSKIMIEYTKDDEGVLVVVHGYNAERSPGGARASVHGHMNYPPELRTEE
jgi:hypothetical protein